MEHYPDIQRRDGMLFFVLPETTPRAAIATSIERLIDMLDAMDDDPDGEDGGDLEPTHGWPNGSQPVNEAMCCDDEREQDNADWEPSLGAQERHLHPWSAPSDGNQSHWAYGGSDDREDDGDDLEPDNDAEYSHGWTSYIDQSLATAGGAYADDGEGEPTLGFVGIATGWREGEDKQDREADQLGGDQLELDASDYEPRLGWTEYQSLTGGLFVGDEFPRGEDGFAFFDGSGHRKAETLLSRAKARREPYSKIVGSRNHLLRDGSVFMTFVPR